MRGDSLEAHEPTFRVQQVRGGRTPKTSDRVLALVALRICRSLNVEEILQTATHEIRRFLKTERVVIYRFEANGSGSIVAESVDSAWPSLLQQMADDPRLADYWQQVFANSQIQVSALWAQDPSEYCFNLLAQSQVRANLVVPILRSQGVCLNERQDATASTPWGFIAAQRCTEAKEWAITDIDFLQQLSIYIEIAIQRAEIYTTATTEVMYRRKAEREVQQLNTDLENRIRQRTVQLEQVNCQLQQEVIDRKLMERNLFAEKELAQITLQAIGDAVITTDAQGKIQYFNPVAEQLTGWKLHEVKGLCLTDVFNIVNEMTRRAVENPLHQVLRSGQVAGLPSNTVLISRDGTEYPIEDSAAPIRASNGEIIGVVLVFHDVTQSRYMARQMTWQANHDDLTGLFNRRTFERQLTDAIVGAKSQDQCHVLCFLDLDRFKAVNDTGGHAAGDELLCQITKLLQERVRLTDTLARLGGDEFGLLLHQCSLEQAQKVADSLRTLIDSFRFYWQGTSFSIGVSIGLVEINADSQNLNTVLSAADAACYAAKAKGRNCIYVYQANDGELTKHRSERQWIPRIDQALRENRFCLYHQKISPVGPQTDVEHFEVLLRMVNETGDLILPTAFIPTAERYHLIPAIDQWVIRTFFTEYCQHHQTQIAKGIQPGKALYAINLSGGSVNCDQFLGFLKEQFAEFPISPANICFEITETTAIANLDHAAQFIHALKDLGCRFALDDFGSGMSSFAYLKKLPVDYLKIDGGFVKDIDRDHMDYAMVEAFNRLSHLMGIQTIAEWVESQAILDQLQSIGVDFAQGYCIATPSPLAFVHAA